MKLMIKQSSCRYVVETARIISIKKEEAFSSSLRKVSSAPLLRDDNIFLFNNKATETMCNENIDIYVSNIDDHNCILPSAARAAGKAAHLARKELHENSRIFANPTDFDKLPLNQSNDIHVEKQLGEGQFSTVHQVRLLHNEGEDNRKLYAVKFLKTSTMMNDQRYFEIAAKDLAIEASYLATLNHPNIINLHGVKNGSIEANYMSAAVTSTIRERATTTRGFFLVMDYIPITLSEKIDEWKKERIHQIKTNKYGPNYASMTLRERAQAWRSKQGELKRKYDKMPFGIKRPRILSAKRIQQTHERKIDDELLLERLRIVHQITDAMTFLHSMKIVYRDLKPENIGFDYYSGQVKIFDFGLAKELKKKEAKNGLYRLTGKTGSLRYMAPEVVKGHLYNELVDVYSFGLLLYELLSLEKPFEYYNRKEHIDRVIYDNERPSLTDTKLNLKLPMEIQRLINKCWSSKISKRPSFYKIQKRIGVMVVRCTVAAAAAASTKKLG